jgi:capsular polysaccharide biosynthesis protein
MSQSLDLRKSFSIIRRLKAVVGVFAAAGLLAGVAYAAFNPPQLSSTAVVSFPASVLSTSTEVVIADSYPVLAAASATLGPPVSVGKLESEVQAKSLTTYLISITATGGTATEAEAAANAVAKSYIAYVGDRKSPVQHVVAELFQPAISAGTPSRLESLLIAGLVGAVVGALVGSVASLAIGRKDRRLRERDQIANSLGVPVLASVSVGHPSDPAGWAKLLENYQPQAVHAWQLRTVLRYLGIVNQTFARPSDDEAVRALPIGNGPIGNGRIGNGSNGDGPPGDGDGVSVAVMSLSSDPGALALGPQLAVFAASQGIHTALVIGPQQDADATAALRTACDVPLSSPPLPGNLRIIVSDDQYVDEHKEVALTVAVAVVDGHAPKMPATARTAVTVIGVSAGRVTAEQLARAAVAAGADGREVTGILVADPELTDKTTGRVPHLTRPPRRRLPSRLKGLVTEIRQ